MRKIGYLNALQDELYKEIRKAIIDLEVKPGERINIEVFAQKLGVSRTPVREVLKRLTTEGLVKFVHRVGPIVSAMSAKEMHDLYEIRRGLEKISIRHAVKKATSKDLSQLTRILDKTRKDVEKGDAQRVRELNREFHTTIFQMSDNDQLIRCLKDIFVRLQRYLNVLSEEDAIRIFATSHHQKIFQAIEKQDYSLAEKTTDEHLIFAEESLNQLLNTKYSEYLLVA